VPDSQKRKNNAYAECNRRWNKR